MTYPFSQQVSLNPVDNENFHSFLQANCHPEEM